MKINYYLYESGELRRKDHSVVLITKNRKVYLPIGQLDAIYVFSSVDVNQNVIKILNDYHVLVFYFTYFGKFIGKYVPHEIRLGKHLIEQVMFFQDETKRLDMAKHILKASISNALFNLKYYRKKMRDVAKEVDDLSKAIVEVKRCESIEDLLVLEARSKKRYYETFDRILIHNDFTFDERSTFPPQNAVNAMMSFGYALLYSRLEGSIHRSRLTLELPFIHGVSRKGSGLQHDIADIFKPVFVDRLIFGSLNKKMFQEEDFEHRDQGVYMTKSGMNKFIHIFEDNMKKTLVINGKTYSYRQILAKEVHKISRTVHDDKKYRPFIMVRW